MEGMKEIGEFEDRLIECVDCHKLFLWEAGEQFFYQSKGLQPPRRCRECRVIRKAKIAPPDKGGGQS